MKKYLYISLLVLTLASCGDKAEPTVTPPDIPAVPEQHAMSFIPGAKAGGSARSRSRAASRAGVPLQDTYDIFRVWSYKTTATSTTETVMPGYQVKWLGEPYHWQYDGTTYTSHSELVGQFLKYWDESATRYDFLGLPVRRTADQSDVVLPEGVTIEHGKDGFTIKGLEGHTSEVKDMVLAHQRRYIGNAGVGLRDEDVLVANANVQQPAVYYDQVPMVFHRMVSEVQYFIYNTGSKDANVVNVEVNLNKGETITTKGDWSNGILTETAGVNALLFKDYSASNLVVEHVTDLTNYKEKAKWLNTYYELPQSLQRVINVSVNIDGAIAAKSFDLPDNAWLPDHTYVYYIRIEAGESQTIPILIDLEVVDFEPGWALDNTQTNW